MQFLEEIKNSYLALGNNLFLLHGNTSDQFGVGKDYLRLRDLLAQELFSKRDVVLFFNPGSGIKFYNDKSRELFLQLVKGYDTLQGTNYFNQLPSSYGEIMRLLDRFLRVQGPKHSIALIVDYANLLFPAEELSNLEQSDVSAVITVLEWAKSHEILNHDITVCLCVENLAEVNKLITTSKQVVLVEVPPTDVAARESIINTLQKELNINLPQSSKSLSQITQGFTTEGLVKLLKAYKDKSLPIEAISLAKAKLIESATGGLVELVETTKKLDLVIGSEPIKKRLREDAELIKQGELSSIPMGYLVCGPVGTGKSYLAECFAGEVGIPAIKLRNFREKWVGATEANWERILNTIKSLAPVLVIVDEADAALGNREQDGDSGTGQRVFAKLAETMGDTKFRGQIIWMLLTSRPELLPIDLKRQGRAEVHLPMLYPKDVDEKIAMFKGIARKVDYTLTEYIDDLEKADLSEINSGADIESVLVKAKRAELIKKASLTPTEFVQIVQAFKSSLDKDLVAKQIAAALAEVTDQELLS